MYLRGPELVHTGRKLHPLAKYLDNGIHIDSFERYLMISIPAIS